MDVDTTSIRAHTRTFSHQKRAFANVNFSTIVMSLTLFGRRSAPPPEFVPLEQRGTQFVTTQSSDAALMSLYLSIVTGFCEETVFRRELPALLVQLTGGNVSLALLGQALLFGLGHGNPGSPAAENAIVMGLQTFNGLGFGLLYVASGGDIVPCILAHALYDFVTFFKTWMDANGQIEYSETMFRKPLPPDEERKLQQLIRAAAAGKNVDPRVYPTIKRLFYTFDFDKNESLSLSEVRKGIAYMALERAGTPPPQEQVDALFRAVVQARDPTIDAATPRDRLSLSDFFRLYSAMMQQRGPAVTASSTRV